MHLLTFVRVAALCIVALVRGPRQQRYMRSMDRNAQSSTPRSTMPVLLPEPEKCYERDRDSRLVGLHADRPYGFELWRWASAMGRIVTRKTFQLLQTTRNAAQLIARAIPTVHVPEPSASLGIALADENTRKRFSCAVETPDPSSTLRYRTLTCAWLWQECN